MSSMLQLSNKITYNCNIIMWCIIPLILQLKQALAKHGLFFSDIWILQVYTFF